MLAVLPVRRVLQVLVRRVRRVLVLLVLGVLLVSGVPAGAQEPAAANFVDRPVVSIAVTIEGRANTETALNEALQPKVGAPLKMVDVRETISHLFSLGRFSDVQVEAEHAANGGVALRFELKPIHAVTKIEFKGRAALPERMLRDRITERFGETPPITRAADVARALQELYEEHGYFGAAVAALPPVISHDPDQATLVFDLTPGAQTVISSSRITGTPLASENAIRSRLRIEPGQPYEPAELRERLFDLAAAMHKRRYYQASALLQAANFTTDRTQIELVVEVQSGPLVTVEFAGDPIPKDKIAELVPVERERSADQDLLEDSARRVEDYLRQLGYWKAKVNVPELRVVNAQLGIVFTVTKGALYRIAPGGVEINGSLAISPEELKPLLRLSPGDPFDASRLSAIEGAIVQVYRTRGYPSAKVESQVNEVAAGLVRPVLVVTEGPRVVVGQIAITGNASITTERLRQQLTLSPGTIYYGPDVVSNRDALTAYYLDQGYAAVEVTAAQNPVATPEGRRADITFTIAEGPQTIIEHIFVTGNVRTKREVITEELQISEGQPLGQAALTESRRRLSGLGLFRRIQISVISHGDPSLRDVVIAVEEARQSTIGYGGGLQVDQVVRSDDNGNTTSERYEVAPRGFFEIGRRNLGGRNRSLNLYSRLSLRPNPDSSSNNPFGFSEYRIVGTYRAPGALRYGDLTATAAIEQGVRTGFNFSRKGFNAELSRRLTQTTRGSARYAFATTRIFDYQLIAEDDPLAVLTVDRVFPQVRLSALSGTVSRDTRSDPIDPRQGLFLSADTTLAIRAIGSEVGFGKTFMQAFVYRGVGRRGFVFAGGARLGLARALLRTVETVDVNGTPVSVQVRDMPASERFFVGGDTTIRGYAIDSVGVPETITSAGFPKGGDAEIVLNAEMRMPLFGNVGAVVFVDGGNVFARAADLDLTRLRGSVGVGGRYATPIGPIRLDVGFKLDRRTIGTRLEPRYAIHFSIGQAF